MLSPSRLSLKIPDSPLEQQAFRSRSFRKLVITISAICLFVVTIHSVNVQHELRRKLAHDYLNFHRNGGSLVWTPSSRQVDEPQLALSTTDRKPDRRPHAVDHLVKQLPEVIRIPFEEAVADIDLRGWEDEWFAYGRYNEETYGRLSEPKIDFVYNWVNGSDEGFKAIKHEYELLSPLNDAHGKWMSEHSINRYRDWDELRYSFRSLEKYAQNFTNKVQLLVNSVKDLTSNDTSRVHPQQPTWLAENAITQGKVQILAQEEFFGQTERQCLPLFDSVSIETQIYNTPSNVDHLVALSDDMFLGSPHSAADFLSPLFGPMIGFKSDHYNVKDISKADVPSFGEKPYLYYTSWLLNHRFGERERKVQAHFTHSVSRRVMKEAMGSFPSPALQGACERFRGESKFQIYPWYTAFHYSIERFREALLWSFIKSRSDTNGDGYLDWEERQALLEALKPGRKAMTGGDPSSPAKQAEGRDRLFYQVPSIHRAAGLQPPQANVEILWTSLDGPETIRNVKCNNFHIDKCLAESFDSPISDASYHNPDFSTSNIFSQLSRREPRCGDCLIKFILSTQPRGLEPLLPPPSRPKERDMIIKALVKYQHTIIEPEAKFVMVKDAEQAQHELLDRSINRNKRINQWCLNDDVMTEDEDAVAKVNAVIQKVFKTLFPKRSKWER